MGDERLRDLERRWRTSGSPEDEAAYLLERVRVGDLSRSDLLLLAYRTRGPGALLAVGDDPEFRLPQEDLERLLEELEAEARYDEVGLWMLIAVVARELQTGPQYVHATVLHSIERFLAAGLVARAYVGPPGLGDYRIIEGPPGAVLTRIEREWSALGHEPTIGDICEFTGPDQAGIGRPGGR